MGFLTTYWRHRSAANVAFSAAIALIVTNGARAGLPMIFEAGAGPFRKGAELLLSVGASLLGFIIAAVTLLFALTATPRFDVVRKSRHYGQVSAASRSAMSWLLASAMFGAAAVFISDEWFTRLSPWAIFTAVFIACQVALATAALTWIIGRLVTIA